VWCGTHGQVVEVRWRVLSGWKPLKKILAVHGALQGSTPYPWAHATHARCINSHVLLGTLACGCYSGFPFHVLQLSQQPTCCICKSMMEAQAKIRCKNRTSLYLVTYGRRKCMLVDSFSENIGHLICVSLIEYGVINKI
jgi:hypothetical protein